MSAAWIRAGRLAVVAVAVITAALSFTHIRDLALAYGGDSLTAPLLPLGIDGAVAAMTVFMHQAAGLALWLSRAGLLVAIGMTVAFNTAYGAAYGVTGAVVWSSPAVLLVICIEVSVLTVRKSKPVTRADETTMVTVAPVADALEPSQPVTPPPAVTSRPKRQRKPARNAAAERQRRYRLHSKGDHSLCLAGNCPEVTRNVTEADLVTVNGNGAHHG